METSFFKEAHHMSFDRSTVTHVQGDQHQTFHNDNRHISGSYNTYNTTNNDSQNSYWTNSDERMDNRRMYMHRYTQNFQGEYSQSQPNLSRSQPHPRNDVVYQDHSGWDSDEYGQPYPTHYENPQFQTYGGPPRYHGQGGPGSRFGPSVPPGGQQPSHHYPDPRPFSPPHPPSSAPPAPLPVESHEAYRRAHPNSYFTQHSQQPPSQYAGYDPMQPRSAQGSQSASSPGFDRNPFRRMMGESQGRYTGSSENGNGAADVDNDSTRRQSS